MKWGKKEIEKYGEIEKMKDREKIYYNKGHKSLKNKVDINLIQKITKIYHKPHPPCTQNFFEIFNWGE